jgi:hypothetical protein
LDEAENRKHFQKALLLALIGIDDLPADPNLQEIGRALLAQLQSVVPNEEDLGLVPRRAGKWLSSVLSSPIAAGARRWRSNLSGRGGERP